MECSPREQRLLRPAGKSRKLFVLFGLPLAVKGVLLVLHGFAYMLHKGKNVTVVTQWWEREHPKIPRLIGQTSAHTNEVLISITINARQEIQPDTG